jgi:hypothetical protein
MPVHQYGLFFWDFFSKELLFNSSLICIFTSLQIVKMQIVKMQKVIVHTLYCKNRMTDPNFFLQNFLQTISMSGL